MIVKLSLRLVQSIAFRRLRQEKEALRINHVLLRSDLRMNDILDAFSVADQFLVSFLSLIPDNFAEGLNSAETCRKSLVCGQGFDVKLGRQRALGLMAEDCVH